MPIRRLLPEYVLGNHAVNHLVQIDRLRNAEINRDIGELIRVARAQALFLHQKVHRFLRRGFHRELEIAIDAHGNIVRGRFRSRPHQVFALRLVHDELERGRERGLDRGAVHLAVALRGMGIAGKERRARVEYRQIER